MIDVSCVHMRFRIEIDIEVFHSFMLGPRFTVGVAGWQQKSMDGNKNQWTATQLSAP